MARNHQPRDDVRRAEKVSRALELRRNGLSERAVAASMGVSQATAHRLIAEGLAAIPRANAEEVRKLELERLDALWSGLTASARVDEKGHVVQGGALEGDPKAVMAAVKVAERRSRLMGLDAPTRVALDTRKPLEQMTDEELAAYRETLEEEQRQLAAKKGGG